MSDSIVNSLLASMIGGFGKQEGDVDPYASEFRRLRMMRRPDHRWGGSSNDAITPPGAVCYDTYPMAALLSEMLPYGITGALTLSNFNQTGSYTSVPHATYLTDLAGFQVWTGLPGTTYSQPFGSIFGASAAVSSGATFETTSAPALVDFTIEGRAYRNSSGYDTLFSSIVGATGMAIYITPSGELAVTDHAVFLAMSATGLCPTATAFSWAVTREGTTIRGFVDGALVFTQTLSIATATTTWRIGFDGVGTSGNYLVDDYRISSTAKYTASYTPSTSPLVVEGDTLALLPMEQTPVATVAMAPTGLVATTQLINLSDGYKSQLEIEVGLPGALLGVATYACVQAFVQILSTAPAQVITLTVSSVTDTTFSWALSIPGVAGASGNSLLTQPSIFTLGFDSTGPDALLSLKVDGVPVVFGLPPIYPKAADYWIAPAIIDYYGTAAIDGDPSSFIRLRTKLSEIQYPFDGYGPICSATP